MVHEQHHDPKIVIFVHVNRHSCLERTVMEEMVPESRDRPTRGLTQDTEDIKSNGVPQAGRLITSQESLGRAVIRAMLHQGPVS